MPRCPFCQQQVRRSAKFCSHCGQSLVAHVQDEHTLPAATPPSGGSSQAMCPHCGAPARSRARFCRQCGKALSPTLPTAPPPEVPLPRFPAPPPYAIDEGLAARRRENALKFLFVTVIVVAGLLLGVLLLRPDDTPVTPAVPTPNIAATLTINAVTPTAPGNPGPVDN